MSEDNGYYEYVLWRHFDEIKRRKRQEPEWAKELLRPEPSERPKPTDDLARQYLEASREQTRHALRQLEHELYVREKLHDQAISQLNYQITEAAHSLERFSGWGVGYNRGVDQKRVELEHRLDTLRREKRTSRLRFWEDTVCLRGQLRELRTQYETAVRRSRLGNR